MTGRQKNIATNVQKDFDVEKVLALAYCFSIKKREK